LRYGAVFLLSDLSTHSAKFQASFIVSVSQSAILWLQRFYYSLQSFYFTM